jgi:hypothetical protein
MTCGEKISGPAEPVPGAGGPPVLALAAEMAARIFPFLEFWEESQSGAVLNRQGTASAENCSARMASQRFTRLYGLTRITATAKQG